MINTDFDQNYLLKSLVSLKFFKTIFLINLNLRFENPILNAKLRQKKIWINKCLFFT